MKKIKLILAILAIILNYPKVSAKLTFGYVPVQGSSNNYSGTDLTMAKLRQAMSELYGDEWLKDYIEKIIDNQFREDRTILFLGSDGQLVFGGGRMLDKEYLIKLKKTFDYLSNRNDTLFISVFNRPESEHHYNIKTVMDNISGTSLPCINKLYVGDIYQKGTEYIFNSFRLCGSSKIFYTDEYRQACEEKGYTYLPISGPPSENKDKRGMDIHLISKKDIDFLVDCINEQDKKAIELAKREPIKISKYSYECNRGAKVYYVREKE